MPTRVTNLDVNEKRVIGNMGQFSVDGLVVAASEGLTQIYLRAPAGFWRDGFMFRGWTGDVGALFESRKQGSIMDITTGGARYRVENI